MLDSSGIIRSACSKWLKLEIDSNELIWDTGFEVLLLKGYQENRCQEVWLLAGSGISLCIHSCLADTKTQVTIRLNSLCFKIKDWIFYLFIVPPTVLKELKFYTYFICIYIYTHIYVFEHLWNKISKLM